MSSDRSLATSSAIPRSALASTDQQLVTVTLKISDAEAGLSTQRCPQCGLNPAGALEPQRWDFVPRWVYLALVAGMSWLAIIAYFAARRTVRGSITLCADCAQAARRGRALRSWSTVGMLVFPIGFGFIGGAIGGLATGGIGMLTGVVSGIAGLVAAHRHTKHQLVHCHHIDKKNGILTLKMSPTCARILQEETPAVLTDPPPPPSSLLGVLFHQSSID